VRLPALDLDGWDTLSFHGWVLGLFVLLPRVASYQAGERHCLWRAPQRPGTAWNVDQISPYLWRMGRFQTGDVV